MKAGLTTSVVLHAAVLALGLVTMRAPDPFDTAVESVPVALMTETEFQQLVQGDRKAPKDEQPAPKPTERPEPVENAQNAGENTVDLDNAPTPEPAPRKVETASAPKAAEEPSPVPDPKPQPKPEAKPAPVPATEVAPAPAPKTEVKPDPVKEASNTPEPDEMAIKLPDSAPVPQQRPEPPKPAETAKAPERKDSDKPAEKEQKTAKAEDIESIIEQTKAVIDRSKPSGGGAKRQKDPAALGASRTNAPKLSAAEMGVLRDQLGDCWSIDAGIEEPGGLRVSVRFNLDQNGKLDGQPKVIKSSGNSQFDRSAVRAVQKCDMRGLAVPPGKYETWQEVIVNFDPTDMFY